MPDDTNATRHPLACPDSMQLSLMGGFELRAGDRPIALPECSQRLVAFVALHDRPQPRPFIAGTLWPDKSEARACANLRAALWRAQGPGSASPLIADGPLLRLAPSVQLDTALFESAGWSIVDDPANATAVDRRLFFQELLPGCYDDWAIIERERLALLGQHFLEALTEGLAAAGRAAEALDTALRLVNADPLRERSQLTLIRVLAAEGSHSRATAQLHSYTELIVTTFGSEPTASFRETALAVIAATADDPTPLPFRRVSSRHRTVTMRAGRRGHALSSGHAPR